MSLLMALVGFYLIWFAMRVSVFNYKSQYDLPTAKDKQIYWGSMPVMCLGVVIAIGSMSV